MTDYTDLVELSLMHLDGIACPDDPHARELYAAYSTKSIICCAPSTTPHRAVTGQRAPGYVIGAGKSASRPDRTGACPLGRLPVASYS